MVGSNKILTVSYGTFSCTLEGFDNPFNTMQSIAEYFRDLAADDRYFGAEPPQPDAQMLHQIAEREVQRRVDARIEDNSVVLRQSDEQPAPVAAPVAVEEDTAPAPVVSEEAPVAEAETGSVADKLSRIRAVVAKAKDTKSADYVEEEDIEDAVFTDSVDGAYEEAAEDEDVDAPLDDLVDEHSDEADDDADSDDLTNDDAELVDEIETVDEVETAVEESDEDILAASDDAQDEQSDAIDDDAAFEEEVIAALDAQDDALEEIEEDDAQMSSEIEDDFDDVLEAAEEPVEDDIALSETDGDIASDDDVEPSDDEIRNEENIDRAVSSPLARIIKLKRQDFEDALASGDIEEVEADEDLDSDDDALIAEIDVDDDNDVEPAAPLVLGPAEEVLDDQIDDADVSDDVAVEDRDDDLTSGIRTLVGSASQDGDHQAGLEDELAKIGREARSLEEESKSVTPKTLDQIVSEELGEVDPDAEDDTLAVPEKPESEVALDRLLDKTNAQMGDQEGNRRRSAIAHLKAAVAATKADGLLRAVRRKDEAEAMDKFREDLAQVVRPRTPDTSEPTDEDGDDEADRPAPLVLVSEQRIEDIEDAAAEEHVDDVESTEEIETVEATDVAQADEQESFSDFAAKLGATELPDLLEAAAAYAKIVEGEEALSRPQLLRRAASLSPDEEISREQGLKSFGQLLRTGRIRKLGQGRFAIAEEERFTEKSKASNG